MNRRPAPRHEHTMRILLVEDDALLAGAVSQLLVDETYAVDWAASGAAADELAAVNDYDLVILDWGIPAPSGIELLAGWRAAGRMTPVLMLTGRGSVADRVGGLDGGADDYLTKPFAIDELLARVRSLLRRGATLGTIPELRAGDLIMDRATHQVRVGDMAVELTPKEFAALEYLLAHRGRVVSRAELSEHVWDDGFDPTSNVVDVLVHRLRRKIDGERPQRLLHTVRGTGYILHGVRS